MINRLASHLGQVRAEYMIPIWVTEFANPNAPLHDSQVFYNQSSQYLDRLEYVVNLPVRRADCS